MSVAQWNDAGGALASSVVTGAGCTARMGEDGRSAGYRDAGNIRRSLWRSRASISDFIIATSAEIIYYVYIIIDGEPGCKWS